MLRSVNAFFWFICAVLLALTLTFWAAKKVRAHEDWISKLGLTDPLSKEWCCNRYDCRREQVAELTTGFLVQSGEIILHERVLWKSQDGSWWRCRNLTTNKTRCLIGPPPAM